MPRIDEEIGVMPVDERVVEPDLQPFGARGGNVFAHEVTPERRLRDLVVGRLRVPQTKSLVVLCRENHVLHAGPLRAPRPIAGIEEVGVEARQISICVGDWICALTILRPLMTGRHGIEPKVDEHAKAVVRPPRTAGVPLCGRLAEDALRRRRTVLLRVKGKGREGAKNNNGQKCHENGNVPTTRDFFPFHGAYLIHMTHIRRNTSF